jgi:hypothetical protein
VTGKRITYIYALLLQSPMKIQDSDDLEDSCSAPMSRFIDHEKVNEKGDVCRPCVSINAATDRRFVNSITLCTVHTYTSREAMQFILYICIYP